MLSYMCYFCPAMSRRGVNRVKMISKDYIVRAAWTVENSFPPADIASVYRMVVSLNLLNAAVKQDTGRQLTSYGYIKGMAACMFLWLLHNPMAGVDIYWDTVGRIAYFRLLGRQFSFHYVPLLDDFSATIRRAALKPLLWDGVQRQLIATQLFDDAVAGKVVTVQDDSIVSLMVQFSSEQLLLRVGQFVQVGSLRPSATAGARHAVQPPAVRSRFRFVRCIRRARVCSDRLLCLQLLLAFNGRNTAGFELSRWDDNWRVRVALFTGGNYRQIEEQIAGHLPKIHGKPAAFLREGQMYYIRRSTLMWKRMTPSRYLLLVAHYNYLTVGKIRVNLCITYGLARYLSALCPDMRFINVLNYTRFAVRRHVYTGQGLRRVPLHSKARTLKVWMIANIGCQPAGFRIADIPDVLVADYCSAPDYNEFFQPEYRRGKVGLVAYSRFHLLKPVYEKIEVYGHFARVKNVCGKWAVYSLMRECFSTGFIYDRIWYDSAAHAVCAQKDDHVDILHKM